MQHGYGGKEVLTDREQQYAAGDAVGGALQGDVLEGKASEVTLRVSMPGHVQQLGLPELHRADTW